MAAAAANKNPNSVDIFWQDGGWIDDALLKPLTPKLGGYLDAGCTPGCTKLTNFEGMYLMM